MERLGLSLFVFLFVVGFIWSFNTVSVEGWQTGQINGVVLDREQKDKDQTVAIGLKSDQPAFQEVTIKLTKKLNKDARVMKMPEGCEAEKEGDNLKLKNCPPSFDFNLGLEIPASYKTDFTKFSRQGLKVEYLTGDGKKSQTFQIKNTPPIVPVKPGDAAYIPQTLRTGTDFSISPKPGYEHGEWSAFIVNANNEKNEMDSKLPEDSGLDLYTDNPYLDQYVKSFTPSSDNDDFLKDYLEQLKETIKIVKALERTTEGPESAGADNQRYFYISSTALGRMQFKYINEFGETVVDDYADDTQIIQDNSPFNMGAPPRLTDCTDKVFVGGELCICGFFPDEYSRNHLLLDGKPIGKPKAGSTDTVLVIPQGLSPGKHVITWNTEAFNVIGDPYIYQRATPSKTERVEFLVLGVEASIDQNKLFTGDGTTMRLKIVGTDEKLPVELVNGSPEIIFLEGGDKQVIMTSGGGENTIERKVIGKKRGNFSITYKIAGSACPCKPQDIAEKINDENEEAKKTQAEEGGGKVDIKPPPPQLDDKVETSPCQKIQDQCRKLAERVKKIEERRQKEIDKCNQLPAGERKACLDQVSKVYDPFVDEEKAKLAVCHDRFRECHTREIRSKKPTPPIREYLDKLNKKTNCDKLRQKCAELVKQKNNLRRILSQKKAECRKKFKDPAKRFICTQELDLYYRPKIAVIQEKLDECRKKLDNCEKGIRSIPGGGSGNGDSPPPNESKNEKPEDCDKLERTCRDLSQKIISEERDLLRALRKCDEDFPNDIAKADACRQKEKETYRPVLDRFKKDLAACRARLAKCRKKDD